MTRRGFTIVELIITITIMGILLTLAVVNISSTQVNARDDKRKSDIESIGNNLESFYTAGVSNAPTITNLISMPSFETTSSDWYTAAGTITRSGTYSYSGSISLKFATTAGNQNTYLSAFIPSGASRTYTVSMMARGTGTVNLVIGVQPGSAIIGSKAITLTSDWQQVSVTGTTASNSTSVYPAVYQVASGAQNIYIDAVMVTEGTTNYNFGDGNNPGWSWSGTVNNSASTGPAITTNSPATYPAISVTSSPLIKAHLVDADLKSFSAPGQTDPYATFIPATNASQTTADVLPQPTIDQYVYQPIDSNGALCYNTDCRKYNLYYRLEKDNTVYMVTSKTQ